mmetsp:Transcript_32946/g.59779  ORF Transcript_32946/g.59779 Transcript_32946/m.59779 type:complete len:290 (+) Transcript_32946:439-1308(+)
MQWNSWPKRDHRQAHPHLVLSSHALHPPVVVVVAEVPHCIFLPLAVRVPRVDSLVLFTIGQFKAVSILRIFVHHGSEDVPVIRVHDTTLQSVDIVNELVGRLIHCVVLSAASHCSVALGSDKELSKDSETLLSQRFRVSFHCRCPNLVEVQRHLHRSVDTKAIHIGAFKESLRHGNVLLLHPLVLQAQIIHYSVDLAIVDLPRVEVIDQVTIVVEIRVLVRAKSCIFDPLSFSTIERAVVLRIAVPAVVIPEVCIRLFAQRRIQQLPLLSRHQLVLSISTILVESPGSS